MLCCVLIAEPLTAIESAMITRLTNLLKRYLNPSSWLLASGLKCPVCKQRTLEFVSGLAFTDPNPTPSYWQCSDCGARLKQLFNGPWEDASGREDDLYYRPSYVGHKDYRD